MDFAAINCKRLVRHARATTGVAAAPAAAAGIVAAAAVPSSRALSAQTAGTAASHVWSFGVCLNY